MLEDIKQQTWVRPTYESEKWDKVDEFTDKVLDTAFNNKFFQKIESMIDLGIIRLNRLFSIFLPRLRVLAN